MPLPDTVPRGLVVGKFCPLHRGHERLIEFAAARCQQLLVIGWSQPGFAGYSAGRRERWLRARFPQATVAVLDDDRLAALCRAHGVPLRALPQDSDSEQVQRAFTAWLCLALFGGPVQAVFTGEDYGDGFAAALAQQFAAPVQHHRLERATDIGQASGTQLRADPHAHRSSLSPAVYADHVQRVAFIGGESTGKSTLARVLGERLGTAWVPEFGRTLWEQQGGELHAQDLLRIAATQAQHEEQAAQHAHRWLFCDTTPLVTLGYSDWMFQTAPAELQRAASRPYDLLFLCAPDIPFVQDGTRVGVEFRARQHAWYLQQLQARGVPYVLLEGDLDARVARVQAALATRADNRFSVVAG
ncbi:AAA family ATPase [Stenotrophomonas sp. YAU14D1_LEIMI4_1]|uniref:AAA family ATPase n=1 Tax=Stenotrophomonas sp. YAU14D1_LEIMI4_1 TaxID=2072407 RepID=UPI000D540785|nr:AAA family ATPase [Stenotrophomonas sp. YAU14D1_LEIMI4_1]AWH23943.1 transcriptional regulator [Stenotrophomonas sp. YAU14D1_LEIMI4_1]